MPTMGWHRNNGNDYDNDDDNGSFSNGSQKGATCAMLEIAIHAIHVEQHFGRPMQQRGRSHIRVRGPMSLKISENYSIPSSLCN